MARKHSTARAGRTAGARLTKPGIVFAPTASELARRSEATMARARATLKRILAAKGRRTVANTLAPYDDLLREVTEVAFQGELVFNAHPNAELREAGDRAYQAAQSLLTELNLNRSLYEAFAALRTKGTDPETRHAVSKILRDFRRAGVDKDEATRARIKALNEEITSIGSEFDRTINTDTRTIELEGPERLEGLPPDFVAAHAPKDGKVTITTQYPDALPVFRYARDPEVRRRLLWEFNNRAYPKNIELLEKLLAKRYELARLLGHADYADYITGNKMIGSAKAAASFIEKVSEAADARLERDCAMLVERKRKDVPGAASLDPWDTQYYTERVRAEQYEFDSQAVRPYFRFEDVRDGIFRITSGLFGVRYRRVRGAPAWDDTVEAFDVYEGSVRLGRFYLDLHPRDGKFSHAAAFPVTLGVRGRQLPQAALVCNFPDPRKAQGPALLEYNDVVTFLHEFGHLLHEIFSGRVRWVKTSMGEIEWDFVEAPSQMLEEWARKPESLRRFALHHQTREPIPDDLVARLVRADAVARGMWVRRQVSLAALSLAYYLRDPAGIDTTQVAKEVNDRYYPVPWYEGTHFQCSFGHLNGYSAVYYTYLWSMVIAKDLFGQFLRRRTIMDTAQARKYRRTILEPGSAMPAGKMVRGYLGRPVRFDAFRSWLMEGAA